MNRALIGASACVCLSLASCQFVFEIRDYVVVEETTATGGGGAGGEGGQGGTGGETGTLCTPLMSRSCYSGPEDTEGVGTCAAGKETCNLAGTGWSTCFGEVVPREEKPEEIGDEACDGYAPGEPVWWRTFGNELDQWPDAIASDKEGNVYVCGSFEGTLQFDDNAPLVSQGSADVFLAKLNAAGEAVWSKSFGGPDHQDGCLLAVDGAGTITLAGNWSGDMFFGGQILKDWAGLARVARFSKDGEHLWSRPVGGAAEAVAIATRANGDVVVTGAFEGAIDFDGVMKSSVTGTDVYLVQYGGGEGQFLWGQTWPDAATANDGDDRPVGLAVSTDDKVGVVAPIGSSVYVGGQSQLTATAEQAFAYVQYSANGVVDWAQLVEFPTNEAFDIPVAMLPGPAGGLLLVTEQSGLKPLAVNVHQTAEASGGLTGYLNIPNVGGLLASGITSHSTGHISLGLAVKNAVVLDGVALGPDAGGGGETNVVFAKLDAAGRSGGWAGTLGGQLEPTDHQWSPVVAESVGGELVLSAAFDKRVTLGGKSILTTGGRDIAVVKLAP